MNRQRAAKMTGLGLMTGHGAALIELARANGTWQVLPDAESAAVLEDLREPLERNEAAHRNFQKFPPSSKRLILEWVATAKRTETRRRRIARTVELAALNIRANHPGVRMRGIAVGDNRPAGRSYCNGSCGCPVVHDVCRDDGQRSMPGRRGWIGCTRGSRAGSGGPSRELGCGSTGPPSDRSRGRGATSG
ncbi:YdeI/OmpD-associated family protein [Micromonospora phytophila]|uniref:YdeI/OmpD-associated family protein n=1 Tax=Micromonospora phytophila TaxID=709888 RepID=UPI0035575E72